MASKPYGVLYTGVTNSLLRRIDQHRTGKGGHFTNKYHCKVLVYYEIFGSPRAAIQRETEIKRWKRQWKLELINKLNPSWKDLYPDILDAYR